MNYKTCCFTGHRPAKFSFKYNENAQECINIKTRLRQEIVNLIVYGDVKNFITGMAQGVDTWAAELVLELKESYPDITLNAAVPFPQQAGKWQKSQQQRYTDILSLCDGKKIISSSYTYNCMIKRNHYMVDNSDVVIAVWNKSFSSGTGKTVEYAIKTGKKLLTIDI